MNPRTRRSRHADAARRALRAEVVPGLRAPFVRLKLARVERHRLLVRVAARTAGRCRRRADHLGDRDPPTPFPELGGLRDWQSISWPPIASILTDDLHHLLVHAPAERGGT